MGPRDGGVVGEGADEPERSERAFVAGVVGMRRSEEAKVSEEAVRRKDGGGPREWGSVLFIGTQFSILYTFMYSPA